MRKKITRFLFTSFLLLSLNVLAQPSINTSNGKIYRFIKTWGLLSMHHPNKCAIDFNALFINYIDSILPNPSINQYNQLLNNMFYQVGPISNYQNTYMLPFDTAYNLNVNWLEDTTFSISNKTYLDSVVNCKFIDSSNCQFELTDSTSSINSYFIIKNDSLANLSATIYSDIRYRLLIYAYYWNIQNYFNPTIHTADISWDSTLFNNLDFVIAATDSSEFVQAIALTNAKLDDEVASVICPYITNYNAYNNQYLPRLALKRVGNKNVVLYSDVIGIIAGDIVDSIDGIYLDSAFIEYSKLKSAGTLVSKYKSFLFSTLRRGFNESIRFSIIDSNNTSRIISTEAILYYYNYYTWLQQYYNADHWTTLTCDYGYINCNNITYDEVDNMWLDFSYKPVLILDMRYGSNGATSELLKKLVSNQKVFTRTIVPVVSYPGYYNWINDSLDYGEWTNSNPYTGLIYVLVDGSVNIITFGFTRDINVFNQIPNSIVYGYYTSQSSGYTLCQLDLPGDIKTFWSGGQDFYPNWYNPQRTGVIIDSLIEPTIEGIRRGEDEILESLLKCYNPNAINNNEKDTDIKIYNSEEFLYIDFASINSYQVNIYDVFGRRIATYDNLFNNTSIKIDDLVKGVYIINVNEYSNKYVSKKIVH